MSARTRWIAMIVGMLGACVIGMIVLIVFAQTRPPQIIPHDDYGAHK